jgi:hypothetical protein
MQSTETRATQHLLVQGFTLYTCAAAVATRLVAPRLLDGPEHTWAVLFDASSLGWCAQLPKDDRLIEHFAEAAVRSSNPKTPHVLCHTLGDFLVLPLDVTDVRHARMLIESAVALGKAPPAERLEAFPDELIEREAKRRAKVAAHSGTNALQGAQSHTSSREAESMA